MRLAGIIFALILLAAPAYALVSFGIIDNSLEYKDLSLLSGRSSVIIINKSSIHREEFYIIIKGYNFRNAAVYRHRVYIDFLRGYGEQAVSLPAYTGADKIFKVKFRVRKNKEFDVREK